MSRNVIAALCLAVLALAAGCQKAAAKQKDFDPLPVRLLKLEPKSIADQDEYLASLTSRRSLTLYSQVTGYVRAIRVRAGDPVKKGALLLEIDPRQEVSTLRALQANLATHRANLMFAVKNEESSQKLVSDGAVSHLEYEQRHSQRAAAEADVEAAEAQVNAQSELLSFYRIVAPTDGVIGDVPVKLGDHVTPQIRLTSVDQNDLIEAYVYIPVAKLGSLRPDSSVALLADQGKVLCEQAPSFVSTNVNVDTQSVLVKTACPNAGELRTAQVLRARVTWARREGLTVPTSVVSRLAGQHFVFVAEHQPSGVLMARQAPIEVGAVIDNDYVVLKGLAAGADIVASSLQKVRDQMPIAPLPPSPSDAHGTPGSL